MDTPTIVDDPVLGPVRRCPRCDDDWPDDEEFYAPGAAACRACEAARLEQWRRASRRYRQRQRVSA